MSPEILSEQGHDYLSDWWALGIVIYELACGEPPFNNRDLNQMAEDIQYEDFPIKSYFSKDLANLLLALTHKIPSMRLGHAKNGGSSEIKTHPFFKKVDWSAVLDKKLSPPIVPIKKVSNDVKSMCSGEANPYALLNRNFDKKMFDKEINLYEDRTTKSFQRGIATKTEKARTSFASDISKDSGHVSNFTYDQDLQSRMKIGSKLCNTSNSNDCSLLSNNLRSCAEME